MARLLLLSVAFFIGSSASAQLVQTLGSTADASQRAASAGDPNAARLDAGRPFDAGMAQGDGRVSPPPVLAPIRSERPVSADLIVGTPGKRQIREPRNPLTPEGKAKPQKSGQQLWWALGGAAAGAGIGFLLGGPIGAAVGGVLFGVLGFIFGP